MGKKISGAQKRKKKKEKEELAKELGGNGAVEAWTDQDMDGLVVHHKDVFVSHVLSKLNTTDRMFFSKVNRESRDVLAYAGVDVSKLRCAVYECSSISTLEWCGITSLGERK